MIGIVITTYNRPEYLRRSLESLAKTMFAEPLTWVIVDDGSGDAVTLQLIRECRLPGSRVHTILRPRTESFGVHRSLQVGWDYLLDEVGCRLVGNIDSDTVVRPAWINVLRDLHQRERPRRGPLLVTGFNTRNHRIRSVHEDYCVKRSCGGINTLFDANFYREIVRDNLRFDPHTQDGWDRQVVYAMQSRRYPILCTRPSVVQHIGMHGRFSQPKRYDQAADFDGPPYEPRGWLIKLRSAFGLAS